MQINIQARDFSLTNTPGSHEERRLRFTLGCCDVYIQRIATLAGDPQITARHE